MRERIESLGGKLSLERDHGTRLLIGETRTDGTRTLLAWLVGDKPAPFAAYPGNIDDGELSGSAFAFQLDGQVHLMNVA